MLKQKTSGWRPVLRWRIVAYSGNPCYPWSQSTMPSQKTDFFISYNNADKAWAEWIAWQLEEAKYTTVLQAWDFRPGTNFVAKMHDELRNSERIIAVLSRAYLKAPFALSESTSVIAKDPLGQKGTLLPVRVEDVELEGLFRALICIDLMGLSEAQARDALLSGIPTERAKPLVEPQFPGDIPRSVSEHPSFPGPTKRKFPPYVIVMLLLLSVVALSVFLLPVRRWLAPPRPCAALGPGTYYEAEMAELSGAASRDTEHAGYRGSGYVSGFGHGQPGTSTTFWVDVPASGDYPVDLCYANATGSVKTLSIFINNDRFLQTRLVNADRWNAWSIQTELLHLRAGRNAISYQKSSVDNGEVNLDFIHVSQQAR